MAPQSATRLQKLLNLLESKPNAACHPGAGLICSALIPLCAPAGSNGATRKVAARQVAEVAFLIGMLAVIELNPMAEPAFDPDDPEEEP